MGGFEKSVLKEVSRSFYLSLRLLPGPMRAAAGLGYLLARTSDTIADAPGLPWGERAGWLEDFAGAVEAGAGMAPLPERLTRRLSPAEARLFRHTDGILAGVEALPAGEARLVREVVGTIIGGQALDLERFAHAAAERPVSLRNEGELEDYAWRVAGCVGAFWTRLGFLTLPGRFATEAEEVLVEKGVRYGKGLQLVNILRDLPEDLANGRCYLPVGNPLNLDEVMAAHAAWRSRATAWVADGRDYAEALVSRRARAASGLPGRIAEETLERMEGAGWEDLRRRIKVPRRRVYLLLLASLFR